MAVKVAIVGSRDYPYLDRVRQYVESLPPDAVVVSGGARGVDRVAEEAARKRGLQVIVFPAEWDRYGKRAGPLRNQKIVNAADMVVAFWDGQSRGTKHTIGLAEQVGRPVVVL